MADPFESASDASTSLSLIRRVQKSDSSSWERLSRLYGPVVYEWARQAGLQPQDASDVMQDVFHALTEKIRLFNPNVENRSFRGWLWTITRNKVRDHFRNRPSAGQATGGTQAYQRLLQMEESPPPLDTMSGMAEQSGLQKRAMELIQLDFEPHTWQAFWRTTVENESPADVAADLGLSKWAVYKARSRVLQRLREEFTDLL